MGGVFVNYRSADQPVAAAAIAAHLADRFGGDQVFRDCVSMDAGEHYPTSIRTALDAADVLVAVIGPRWADLTDPATGRRLIKSEHDWVRLEIARAFERGIPVIPVLLLDTPENARRPTREDLPPDIAGFAAIQAIEVSQRRLADDLHRLAVRLVGLVPTLVTPQVFAGPAPPRDADAAPSTLLRAEYAVVPFRGRQEQLADLRSWATDSAVFSARLVLGPAGCGKTRLAMRLCAELAGDAGTWLTGIASARAPAVQIGHTAGIDRPLLVVVDDAELRTDQLVAFAAALADRSAVHDAPARLLLLARSSGEWLTRLRDHADESVAAVFRRLGERSPVVLDPGTSDAGTSDAGRYAAAHAAFAAALSLPERPRAPGAHTSLLEVHAAALDALLSRNAAPEDPLARLMEHDRRHWRRLARAAGESDLDTARLATVATVATLCRPVSEDQARALLTRLPAFLGVDEPEVERYAAWARRIHPGPHSLNPVRPDLLGEHLVAATLAAEPATAVTLAVACTDEEILTALTVLGRAMPRHPGLGDAVTDAIRVDPGRLVTLGVEAAGRVADPVAFSRAVGRAIEGVRLDPDVVFALMNRLHTGGPTLHPVRGALLRTYADVFAHPMVAGAQEHAGITTPPGMENLLRVVTDKVVDAFVGFIDPGSGRFPTLPGGRELVDPRLLEALRKVAVDGEWFPRRRPPTE